MCDKCKKGTFRAAANVHAMFFCFFLLKRFSQEECLKEDKSRRKGGEKYHAVSGKVRELGCSSLTLTTEGWLLLAL